MHHVHHINDIIALWVTYVAKRPFLDKMDGAKLRNRMRIKVHKSGATALLSLATKKHPTVVPLLYFYQHNI